MPRPTMTPSNNKTNKCKDANNNTNKDANIAAKVGANNAANNGSSPYLTGYDIIIFTAPTEKTRQELHLDNAISMNTHKDPDMR